MRLIETQRAINKEVILLLEKAGLRNGDLLDDDEFKSLDKDVPFWNTVAERKEASSLPLNVVWQFIEADPVGKADDNVAVRSVYVGIDVYTTNKVKKQDLMNLLDKIDKAFTSNGWGFEKASFDSVNREEGKTSYRFEAIKKF